MNVRPLKEVLKDHPDYKPKYAWDSKNNMLFHQKYSVFEHVVVCKDGEPRYDTITVTDKPCLVIVPYDFKAGKIRIALIHEYRPIPASYFIAAPRGIAESGEKSEETAKRELKEETGYTAEFVHLLGRINLSSAVITSFVEVAAAKVADLDHHAILNPDLNEEIEKVLVYSWPKLKKLFQEKKLECSITNAAIQMFGAWKTEFYKE